MCGGRVFGVRGTLRGGRHSSSGSSEPRAGELRFGELPAGSALGAVAPLSDEQRVAARPSAARNAATPRDCGTHHGSSTKQASDAAPAEGARASSGS